MMRMRQKPIPKPKCQKSCSCRAHNDILMFAQGRLTLLMGPPRSGKSLFMQMLGGKAGKS